MTFIRRLFGGISLPVILLIAYIALGFVSGVITGETNLVALISEHRLLLAILVTWIIVRLVKR